MLRTSILTLLTLVLFVRCNNTATKENSENNTSDSTISKLNSPDLKSVNELLKLNPNSADLYLQRGKIYLQLKDFDAAIEDGKRSLKIDSLKDASYLFLTDAYFFSNKTRQAKEILVRCVKNIPTSTEGHLKLAELYFYVKKYQESISSINEALKLDETIAKGYFLKGMCYKESGDTGRAVSSLQTACEQDNQYYDAYVEVGRLFALKKNPLSVEYFNNALKINPKSTEVIYLVAKYYQDAGKIKEAVDAYTKLLEIDKQNKNALYNLGAITYAKSKNPEKAKDYFSLAIEADPQYAEAYFARGVCYEDLKKPDDAIADYKLAAQYRPNYESAITNLNRLLDKSKDR